MKSFFEFLYKPVIDTWWKASLPSPRVQSASRHTPFIIILDASFCSSLATSSPPAQRDFLLGFLPLRFYFTWRQQLLTPPASYLIIEWKICRGSIFFPSLSFYFLYPRLGALTCLPHVDGEQGEGEYKAFHQARLIVIQSYSLFNMPYQLLFVLISFIVKKSFNCSYIRNYDKGSWKR